MIQAIKDNHTTIIKMLLEAGAEEEIPTPLKQKVEEVALAMLQGNSLKELEEEHLSASALAMALQAGNVDVIRYMYERIPSLNFIKKARYKKSAICP